MNSQEYDLNIKDDNCDILGIILKRIDKLNRNKGLMSYDCQLILFVPVKLNLNLPKFSANLKW